MTDKVVEPGQDPKVRQGILGPSDIWKEKERFTKLEADSKEYWDKMPQEHREAIVDIVDRALDRLKNNLDTWVPYALEPKSGHYLEVKFWVVFSEIDEEVLRKETEERHKIEEAKTGVVELVHGIEVEAAPESTEEVT
jgi:hypothetical protein